MDPVPATTQRKTITIHPFQIMDKQLFAKDNRVMYWVDYTDAAKQSDWKYRQDIEKEFGELGRRILDQYNQDNADVEVPTMWAVQSIIGKRYKKGVLQYHVLWDTPGWLCLYILEEGKPFGNGNSNTI